MAAMEEVTTLELASAGRIESLGAELGKFLSKVKSSVDAEIGAYPTPIPRCDAQFNYLFELRGRLSHLLARANAIPAHGTTPSDLCSVLAEFIASAAFTEGALEQALRERISAEISRPDHAS